jgi:hypothetical protein
MNERAKGRASSDNSASTKGDGMEFLKAHRKDCHQGLLFRDTAELFNRNCDVCKERLWTFHIEASNPYPYYGETFNNSREFIAELAGHDDGYTLVCASCWKEKLSGHLNHDHELPTV